MWIKSRVRMIEHLKYVIYVGILVSFYSIYVEFKLGKKKYKPLCDISKKFSCSVAFKSKYGRVFDVDSMRLQILSVRLSRQLLLSLPVFG